MCSDLMTVNMISQYQLVTALTEISAFKPRIDQTCQSFLSPITALSQTVLARWCWRLMQFCTAVWLHVKLHLVLPQAGTESLRRISVGFWCITTSRDGEGGIQTGRGFLALLSTLMGSPTREASPPSQWRNTATSHYITLAEAPKGDSHLCAWHDWFLPLKTYRG